MPAPAWHGPRPPSPALLFAATPSSLPPLPLTPSSLPQHPLTPPLLLQLLRGIERYVESVRVEVLPGSSHWVQQDRPEEVNRLLASFLGAAAR